MRHRKPKKLVFRSVLFKDVIEICAHLQAECRIKHARYSLIIMIIQKPVKKNADLLCKRSCLRDFDRPSWPPNALL